jgi:hypothetical protein
MGSSMTESELQTEVIRLCERHGALVFHSGDSRRDVGRGFPDLVITGIHGVLFRELKTDYSALSPTQVGWKHMLLASRQDFRVWRPADLADGTLEEELRRIA